MGELTKLTMFSSLDDGNRSTVISNDGIMLRGDYHGWAISAIARENPNYLKRVLKSWDITDDDARVIKAELEYYR